MLLADTPFIRVSSAGSVAGCSCVPATVVCCFMLQDVFGAPLGSLLDGCGVPRRSLKRSAPSAESADTLGYHSSAATRLSPAPCEHPVDLLWIT
jgi:hypothetical protein